MSNPNIFKEPGSGEQVCPSGCSGVDMCQRVSMFTALKDTSLRLNELTDERNQELVGSVYGGDKVVRVEAGVQENIANALAGSCLLYHQMMSGDLTD